MKTRVTEGVSAWTLMNVHARGNPIWDQQLTAVERHRASRGHRLFSPWGRFGDRKREPTGLGKLPQLSSAWSPLCRPAFRQQRVHH